MTAQRPAAGLDEISGWLATVSRVTVLTGAGISTDSGIPDFRGPNGVWTRDPAAAQMSNLDNYVQDPEIRRQAWRHRLQHPAWDAKPNAAHQALVDLERAGRLHAIVTQNIDGLHQRAGSDPARVIEVHGTIFDVECLGCADRTPMKSVLARVEAGEEDPSCRRCSGILKSATVSFGQQLDAATLRRAFEVAAECDLFLAVGTLLQVYPVAGLVPVAARAGARVVIVNGEPTPFDDDADGVLRGPIGEVLPALVAKAAAQAG
ncbi:MAG TPA: Sir2 family NAD-dependent protein deacetylase [Micromonosporaceae bacterium]|nr:Sir2 family NAD-dependent protein deacetylase [Micromonosporaceae bacterium]